MRLRLRLRGLRLRLRRGRSLTLALKVAEKLKNIIPGLGWLHIEPSLDPPAPGLYHFTYQGNQESSHLHLRIEPDGNGLLLVNASRLVHLNPTAAFMSYLALRGVTENQAIKTIKHCYDVPVSQARSDYRQLITQIQELSRPDGACPVHDLDLDVTSPFSLTPSAPYRMDLAVTYRCNNDCSHCYNARPRSFTEISTEEWFAILDKLWEIGIPHVVFTGGEPTLREDLPRLISHAQQNGQITGINTNGRRLKDQRYLDALIQAGLDHVQITLESHDEAIHDRMVRSKGAWEQTVAGLSNALRSKLYVMTNTTLLTDNSLFLNETLDFLGEKGVPTVGLNALIYSGRGLNSGQGLAEEKLGELLTIAREKTQAFGQKLIWYTPTQYCHFDPMQFELGVKGCTAALYNMCIEPNGDIIPCQSYYQAVGNILRDTWESIWNHDLCLHLRERKYIQAICQGCALLSECGGGCPLILQAGREG